ncbi:MAG: hypothetical protein ACJAYR_002103 [Sneathiella sp.]|jgi:hypothetical protein
MGFCNDGLFYSEVEKKILRKINQYFPKTRSSTTISINEIRGLLMLAIKV